MQIFWLGNEKRVLFFLVGLLVCLSLIQMGLVGAGRMVMSVLSQKIIPIYRVDTQGEKKVALTFDATWGADYTPKLLEILRQEKVKATFYLAGFWIEKYPEMVKKIAQEGHELGNHTYSHPHLNSLGEEEIKKELTRTHQMLKELTGKDSTVFRPPFGEYSNKVIKVAEECGYKTIIWDVDSLDWKNLSAAQMQKRILERVRPGSIVLMHNAGLHTPEALPGLIKELKKRGYKFTTTSELLIKGPYYIQHDGEQKPKEGTEGGRATV
ncbi:MAG TPA: polysaccharide deacetylase family sporulation protein PdaB [Bacillota bacterium]|nr:polysaccharide deacetylase family sporulation protein PdaB [Bacillota bacterium]